MKVIKPSFQIITPIDSDQILKTIETVGRTCYKSEDKITDDCLEIFCENWQNPVKQRITPHFLTTSPSNYYEFTTKE